MRLHPAALRVGFTTRFAARWRLAAFSWRVYFSFPSWILLHVEYTCTATSFSSNFLPVGEFENFYSFESQGHECIIAVVLSGCLPFTWANRFGQMVSKFPCCENPLGTGAYICQVCRNPSHLQKNLHDGDGERERHETKALINKTTTLHVRYFGISLTFCAQLKGKRKWCKYLLSKMRFE